MELSMSCGVKGRRSGFRVKSRQIFSVGRVLLRLGLGPGPGEGVPRRRPGGKGWASRGLEGPLHFTTTRFFSEGVGCFFGRVR